MLRGRSQTKPGSLLKSQIPVRTWADRDDAVPVFAELDLFGHEGGVSSGQFCFPLTVTDIATGWTVNRSVPNKAQKWVFATLQYALARFPLPILGIDSDNGSEFINDYLEYRMSARSRSRAPGPATRTTAPMWNRRTGPVCANSWATTVTTPPPNWRSSTKSGGLTRSSRPVFPATETALQGMPPSESRQETRCRAHTAPARGHTLQGPQAPGHHHERLIQKPKTRGTIPADPRLDRSARSTRPSRSAPRGYGVNTWFNPPPKRTFSAEAT